MKKIFISGLVLFLVLATSFAQEEDFFNGSSNSKTEKPKRNLDKWAFGGNFWLSFGTNSYVELSPVAMYKATPRLMVGPGFTYIYQKNKSWGYETSTYGPRAIATYTLFANLHETLNINVGNIVLHSEYEYLNIEKFYLYQGGAYSDGREWISTLLVGGGIYQPLGNRGGFSILVLYNFIEHDFSPYSNPVIRVGFYF